jgi:23S rRNA-intervening sequence protein
MVRSNRDLIVWKKSTALVLEIYRRTQTFPRIETYGLTSQLRGRDAFDRFAGIMVVRVEWEGFLPR